MRTNPESRWYKAIGGDSGAVKLNGHWTQYRCLMCARYRYPEIFKTPRWQGPPNADICKALRADAAMNCEGAETHRQALFILEMEKAAR